MVKCYPMIIVGDVVSSSQWYQQLLGASSGHGGDEFEMLMDGHELLLMLHHRDFTEHPALTDPREGIPGRGVLLYFYVDDVQAAHERAEGLGADFLDEPHENPKARAMEFSLRDPDGYAVTIAQTLRT